MTLRPDLVYTTKEASELTGAYTRKLTRLGKKHNVQKIDNTYVFTGAFLIKHLQSEHSKTEKTDVLNVSQDRKTKEAKKLDLKEAIELITVEAMHKDLQYRVFTNEEYDDVIGKMELVEHQQEQIKYLRERIAKQDAMLQGLAKQIEQRTFIEAKEKGLDKE